MEQKSVLITGASRGIGAETARLFAESGYAVALNYCSSEREALALAKELSEKGYPVLTVQADVSDPVQVESMVDKVCQRFGKIDILICNAGVSDLCLLGDMTDERWRKILSINLDGVFYCCRAVLPHFIHRKEGKILTLSSMWGQVGASCEVAYSASKAGVIGFTKALAKELGPSKITVNCVAPGIISTEMNHKIASETMKTLEEETPLGRLGTPRDVAETLLFLASEKACFFTGQVISPNGGFVI